MTENPIKSPEYPPISETMLRRKIKKIFFKKNLDLALENYS